MSNVLFSLQYSLTTLGEAVNRFWQQAKDFRIIAFEGEMGAGKTTFIHELCQYLDVQDAVSSPTFALINEYHFQDEQGNDKLIYHMDWYRVRDAEEAIQAGMEDAVLNANAYCFIEWAEKAIQLLPHPYLMVKIEAKDVEERKMVAYVVE